MADDEKPFDQMTPEEFAQWSQNVEADHAAEVRAQWPAVFNDGPTHAILERARGRLVNAYGDTYGPITPERFQGWVSVALEQGLTADDIDRALEFYLQPPWPAPVLLLRAHTERIEYENHEASMVLAHEAMRAAPSERRDALLRELGFSRVPPTKPPKQSM